MFQQNGERERNQKVKSEIGHGADAHGKAADFQRHNFRDDNPANRAEGKGKAGNVDNNAADGNPFEAVAEIIGEPESSAENKQACGDAGQSGIEQRLASQTVGEENGDEGH